MDLSNLKPAEGSIKKGIRIARGQGSGKGGTSTRGHKGAKSRSGYKSKKGFEGGQMPLQRRIPKFGFKNINRVDYVPFNLDRVEEIATAHGITEFTHEALVAKKIISKSDLVKVLGNGELKTVKTFKVHKVSKSAQAAIEQAGGSVELI